jgi:pSer/pThr/pTyr-binding forkhead associated (FHA) protein
VPEDYNPTCLLSDIAEQPEDTAKILLKSPDEEQYSSICIEEFPFFIGKLRKNVDYCLEKNVVSRYHAKLTKEEEDKYYITDLNSTNGTFVNERLLTSYEKKEIIQGDRIALANLNFEFQNR